MKKLMFLLLTMTLAVTLFATGEQEEGKDSGTPLLTIWEDFHFNVSHSAENLGATPTYQELMKRTGVKVKFIHPPQGNYEESFNLMIASGELPDMIYYDWMLYPGGPSKAVADGVIMDLTPIVDEFMPNLKALYEENPVWEKAAKNDDGILYSIPFIRGDKFLMTYYGPQLRKDWLDELGLALPETMDEWTKVLRAFKSAGKAEYPLTFTKIDKGRGITGSGGSSNSSGAPFIHAFGTTWDFYQENGEIHFGPYEENFKDFLIYFKAWFDEGLVDPDLFVNERKTFDAKILNSEAGAWSSYTGSGIGAYMDANKGQGDFEIIAAKYPVLNKGDVPFFTQMDFPVTSTGLAITTACKDIEAAAKFADYAYGEEGHILMNFGIEGESFNWTDNYPGYEGIQFPEYTEAVTADPKGRTLAQMGSYYSRAFYSGPIVQDKFYMIQYARRQSQKDAIDRWGIGQTADHMVPLITPTPEEAEILASIMSEISTYREEMLIRFILGQEPIENFGAFQKQLMKMGLDKAIAIKQAALDRYNAR